MESFEKYGDEVVKTNIISRISDPLQFRDIMIELYIGSWHILEGHKLTLMEKKGYPDFKVEIDGYELPIICARV